MANKYTLSRIDVKLLGLNKRRRNYFFISIQAINLFMNYPINFEILHQNKAVEVLFI